MNAVLNGLSASSFHTTAGVLQGLILYPTLFLIFNCHPDVIRSQVGIYAEDTTIYSCLNSKSSNAHNQ